MIRTHDGRRASVDASERSDGAAQIGVEWIALVAPTALGAAATLVTLVAPAWASETVIHGLGVATFCAAAVGFVVLLADADRLRESGAAWQPSAWPLLAGGAAVAAGVLLAVVPRPDGLAPGFYGGVAIVAVFLAPAVVGPLYLALRRRGLADAER